jgi:hypothetical protein
VQRLLRADLLVTLGFLLLGIVCLSAGAALVYPPAGVIVFGALCLAAGAWGVR